MVTVLNKQITEMAGETSYTTKEVGDYPLYALEIYGKSTQNGTPTPETPAPIVSVGDDGFDFMIKGAYNVNGIAWRTQGEVITRQPVSAIAKVDEFVTFSVDGGTSYQWQQNTGGGWSDIATVAGRSKSYKIAGALFRNGYKYRCVVTDNNGNSETSNIATLYVVSADSGVASGVIPSFVFSPLCRVGDDYDELIYSNDGTGKIIRRTKMLVLDGSDDEGWKVSSSKTRIQKEIMLSTPVEQSAVAKCICDKLQAVAATQTWNGVQGISLQSYESNSVLHICIASLLDNYDLDVWKAWLALNPLTVIYALAEPQEIKLSATEMANLQQLQTFSGTTNIFNNGNGEMYVKAMTADFEYGHEVGFFDSKI